jgi:hypothetical protein
VSARNRCRCGALKDSEALQCRKCHDARGAPNRTPARLEREEQSRGVKLLKRMGWQVYTLSQYRRSNRGTGQTPGLPDVLAFHVPTGRAVWWECKQAGGRQREAQRAFMTACRAAGWPYVLGTFAALTQWLNDDAREAA